MKLCKAKSENADPKQAPTGIVGKSAVGRPAIGAALLGSRLLESRRSPVAPWRFAGFCAASAFSLALGCDADFVSSRGTFAASPGDAGVGRAGGGTMGDGVGGAPRNGMTSPERDQQGAGGTESDPSMIPNSGGQSSSPFDGGVVTDSSTVPREAGVAVVAACESENPSPPCTNSCGELFEIDLANRDDVRLSCQQCPGTGLGDADGDGVEDGCDQCGVSVALRSEPIFYFTFDDAPGRSSAFNSGSANTSAQMVGPVVSGRRGIGDTQSGAFFFPGATGEDNSRVTVQNVLGWPAEAITVAFWVRTQQDSDASIVSYATDDGSSNEFGLIFEPESLRFTIEGVGFNVPELALSQISNGGWRFIAVTWQGTEANFFLDGARLLSIETTVPAEAPGLRFDPGESLNMRDGGTLILGQDQDTLNGTFGTTQSLIGGLDEVAIYPIVLSPDTIAELFTSATCGEVCNSEDDDHDGSVDEGFRGSGPSCPASSCDAIAQAGLDFGSGNYFLQSPTGGVTQNAFCSFF